MKGLIVYVSKSGATERYARWLAEVTGFELATPRRAKRLADYDLVLLGSCVRMYKLTLAGWIKSHWRALSGTKAILFSVAGAPADSPKRQEWLADSLGDIAAGLEHFPLDGKMVLADLSWLDRKLMEMGMKMVAKSKPEQAAQMGREYDNVKIENLAALRARLAQLGAALRPA